MNCKILSTIIVALLLLSTMVLSTAYSVQNESSSLEEKFGIQFPTGVDENTFVEKRKEIENKYENFADPNAICAYPDSKAITVNVVGTVLKRSIQ